jgi:hypothetical protein
MARISGGFEMRPVFRYVVYTFFLILLSFLSIYALDRYRSEKNTIYSKSFSRSKFDSIRIGDLRKSVISKIGLPLETMIFKECYSMRYTASMRKKKISSSRTVYTFSTKPIINKGKAKAPSSIRLNSSGIATTSPVKGLTRNQIIELYGSPLSEDHYTSNNRYQYSTFRNPRVNYRIIEIKFDHKDRVVRIGNLLSD